MEPWAFKVFEYATAIFVVTTADVIVINQTKRVLEQNPGAALSAGDGPDHRQPLLAGAHHQSADDPEEPEPRAFRARFPRTSPPATARWPRARRSAWRRRTRRSRALTTTSSARCSSRTCSRSWPSSRSRTGVAAKVQAAATALPSRRRSRRTAPRSLQRSSAAPLDAWTAMKLRIHKALVEQMDLKKTNTDTSDPKQRAILREKTQKAILDILDQRGHGGAARPRASSRPRWSRKCSTRRSASGRSRICSPTTA